MTNDNVIAIEGLMAPLQDAFKRLMELVPAKHREDIFLQRLIAVRLKIDGEEPTREYMIRKMEQAAQCGYTGSLFDFFKDDFEEAACEAREGNPQGAG
ncbi:MAG: hypothetical protein ACOZF0_15970 [Thermodesulfobacteriota bacterium]